MLKMTKSNYEKSRSGTTRTINFGPLIYFWLDALLSLWETKIFRKSQKSVQSSVDLWPFRLLDLVWMPLVVQQFWIQGPPEIWHVIYAFGSMLNTTLKLLTSSEMSAMLAMYNGQYHATKSVTTRTINFGPIYVIYAFGSISVRDKNFQKVTNWRTLVPGISSEQRDLWFIGSSLNAMELVVRN